MRLRIYYILFILISTSWFSYGQNPNEELSSSAQIIAVDVLLEKATQSIQSAQFGKSNDYLNSSLEIAKDSIAIAKTKLVQTKLYLATNRFNRASKNIEVIGRMTASKGSLNKQLQLTKIQTFLKTGKLVEAKEELNSLNAKIDTLRDKSYVLEAKFVSAQLYYQIENWSQAKKTLNGLSASLEQQQLYYDAAQSDLLLSSILYKESSLVDASSTIDNSIALGSRFGFTEILSESYRLKAQILKDQGSTEESLSYLERYTELSSTVNNTRTNPIVQQEISDLKAANKKLLSENKLKDQELKGHDTSYILLCVFITLLSLLTLSLFKNNKLRAKSNNVLEDKNSDLIDERDRAQDAAKIKADFLSTITHELRTPLYAVTGLTHLLLDKDPRKDQQEHLETLQSSGEYLLSLIDNILDFNKLEANKVELESIPFDLKKRVQDICSSLKGQSSDKQNRIIINHDPSIPSRLQGDPVKISQILINLIGNSIKFTKNGEIHVNTKQIDSRPDKSLIRFEVQDNGKGISQEKQEAIFENFTQEGASISREYGGTGLGLAIVKNLIELMGGKIELHSEVNKGSKFSFDVWFNLPDSNSFTVDKKAADRDEYKISQPQVEKREVKEKTDEVEPSKTISDQEIPVTTESAPTDIISSQPPTPKDLLNKKILIVEDNKINQMITRKILEGKNFSCEVANNGMEAVEIMRSNSFDLILMDIHMPIMDGKEAVVKIRTFDRVIPIIALTAVTLNESEKEFYELGFDDIIPKPFKMDEFFNKIQKSFSKYKVL